MTRLRALRRLLPTRRRTEQGYAAILVAAMTAAVMLPLCAISVDIARLYVEAQRLQNAADAAAMAGVTFMPDDLTNARATAIAVAKRNGFDDASSSVAVYVEPGSKPTQLKVTIDSTVFNTFASSFNSSWATVSRYSIADYNGPAPMGSPCNTFGNEPTPGAAETTYPGSQLVSPTGGASCSTNPQFWGAIAGPETPKGNGDQVMTRKCTNSTDDGCSSGTNDDFDPLGYFYIVRVAPGASGPVTLQIYDPSFVETNDTCGNAPDSSTNPGGVTTRDQMNPYTTDGNTRYAKSANTFCTGDVLTDNDNNNSTPSTYEAPITSFALRAPTDTYKPVNGSPVAGCTKQYKGFREDETPSNTTDNLDVSSARLRQNKDDNSANSLYNQQLSQVFHQWVTFCTFTPSGPGDYYLQVRTDVALGGSADGLGGYQGNSNVTSQMSDDNTVKGNGNNRFALRVVGSARSKVSIAGWDHMGIYANYTGAQTTFNLVRVIPASASKSLLITFFDVGDATNPGTIKVLGPQESGTNLPTPLTGCTGSGVVNGPLTDCQLTSVSSSNGWNGQIQNIRVPIPSNYTCNSTQTGGCWFRLQVSFPGGVSDTTTWSARVEGDPVRLIE